MEYIYNKSTEQSLVTIHTNILNSTMNDKSLEYCIWDEESGKLSCRFTNTLIEEDKNKLDEIIGNL